MFHAIAVGSVFLALGLHILLWWRRKVLKCRCASSWPVTGGFIVASRISYPTRPDDTESLDFLFRYEVDGKLHASRRIDLFGMEQRIQLDEMKAVVERYPEGREVMVHYDPMNPSEGVLEPGNLLAAPRVRNMGILLLAAGAFFLLSSPRFS